MPTEADILVIFGITGDLAKKMTFEALYRLERRGELNCRRILGIARNKWDRDELDGQARESIEAKVSDPDEEAIKRLDERLDYVQGEFDEPELYKRLAEGDGRVRAGGLLPRDPAVAVRDGGQGPPRRGDHQATRGWCSRSRSATTGLRRRS